MRSSQTVAKCLAAFVRDNSYMPQKKKEKRRKDKNEKLIKRVGGQHHSSPQKRRLLSALTANIKIDAELSVWPETRITPKKGADWPKLHKRASSPADLPSTTAPPAFRPRLSPGERILVRTYFPHRISPRHSALRDAQTPHSHRLVSSAPSHPTREHGGR